MTDQKQQQPKTLTAWRDVLKRKGSDPTLLYAEDLGPVGTDVDAEVIDSGVLTTTGPDSKTMPWLAFRGPDGKPRKKRLGLNATMCKTMKAITGSNFIEEWRGWITLTVVDTEYRDSTTGTKERTEAIRIAPKRPQPKRGARQPDAPPAPVDPKPGWTGDPPLTEDEAREIAAKEAKEAGRG